MVIFQQLVDELGYANRMAQHKLALILLIVPLDLILFFHQDSKILKGNPH